MNHLLQDILAGYPVGYPICCLQIPIGYPLQPCGSASCLQVPSPPRIRLSCVSALNQAGGFSKSVSIPHSQGPVRPERPALAPQRRRRGARAAQQRRTARWHRKVPVKGTVHFLFALKARCLPSLLAPPLCSKLLLHLVQSFLSITNQVSADSAPSDLALPTCSDGSEFSNTRIRTPCRTAWRLVGSGGHFQP